MNNLEVYIKKSALALGFTACGIAEARHLIEEEKLYRETLNSRCYEGLPYLERDIEKRFNPQLFLPGCRSMIVCLYNYFTPQECKSDYKIAKYARLTDYHTFLREKLERLATDLRKDYPEMEYKISVDSSAIAEKIWAVKAGLGSIGKNTILQTVHGSYFLIAILLTTLPLAPDPEQEVPCGNCMRCLTACPTHALVAPYRLDARQCITFHNIENKNSENDFYNPTSWIFGCDECQDACPHNQKATYGEDAQNHFSLFLHFENETFENLEKAHYKKIAKTTPLERAKFEKISKEINRVKNIVHERDKKDCL